VVSIDKKLAQLAQLAQPKTEMRSAQVFYFEWFMFIASATSAKTSNYITTEFNMCYDMCNTGITKPALGAKCARKRHKYSCQNTLAPSASKNHCASCARKNHKLLPEHDFTQFRDALGELWSKAGVK
jgi:hypothetical protein